jgi:hypothetical protein
MNSPTTNHNFNSNNFKGESSNSALKGENRLTSNSRKRLNNISIKKNPQGVQGPSKKRHN